MSVVLAPAVTAIAVTLTLTAAAGFLAGSGEG